MKNVDTTVMEIIAIDPLTFGPSNYMKMTLDSANLTTPYSNIQTWNSSNADSL